jgi:hypothetical protein
MESRKVGLWLKHECLRGPHTVPVNLIWPGHSLQINSELATQYLWTDICVKERQGHL